MSAIVVLSSVEHQCVTFFWPDDLRYFVGYRLFEGQPKVALAPLPHSQVPGIDPPSPPKTPTTRGDNWLDNWRTEYTDPQNPLRLRFQTFADGSAVVECQMIIAFERFHVVVSTAISSRTAIASSTTRSGDNESRQMRCSQRRRLHGLQGTSL